ncbi:hypothetical protein F9K33_06585 [bacterium]|nr:MAG: hypothetical protein F9K33_06585 [bacterium]
MSAENVTQSIITCPNCQHQKEETMPDDACMFFYTCENCGIKLRPQNGDCCVFCSYGSESCPPVQAKTMFQNRLSKKKAEG